MDEAKRRALLKKRKQVEKTLLDMEIKAKTRTDKKGATTKDKIGRAVGNVVIRGMQKLNQANPAYKRAFKELGRIDTLLEDDAAVQSRRGRQ